MKVFLTFILLTLCLCSFAQTDSTEIKLQRYKELHEKGLLTDQEYDLLKKKELSLETQPQQQTVKKDTISLDKLERTYKFQIITGTIELGAGIGLIGGFIHFRNKEGYTSSTGWEVDYKRQARLCLAFSGLFTGIGIYSLVKGAKNRTKYIEQISVSPTSTSISIRF